MVIGILIRHIEGFNAVKMFLGSKINKLWRLWPSIIATLKINCNTGRVLQDARMHTIANYSSSIKKFRTCRITILRHCLWIKTLLKTEQKIKMLQSHAKMRINNNYLNLSSSQSSGTPAENANVTISQTLQKKGYMGYGYYLPIISLTVFIQTATSLIQTGYHHACQLREKRRFSMNPPEKSM